MNDANVENVKCSPQEHKTYVVRNIRKLKTLSELQHTGRISGYSSHYFWLFIAYCFYLHYILATNPVRRYAIILNAWSLLQTEGGNNFHFYFCIFLHCCRCLTDHPWFDQVLQEGPLHMEYVSYLRYHGENHFKKHYVNILFRHFLYKYKHILRFSNFIATRLYKIIVPNTSSN